MWIIRPAAPCSNYFSRISIDSLKKPENAIFRQYMGLFFVFISGLKSKQKHDLASLSSSIRNRFVFLSLLFQWFIVSFLCTRYCLPSKTNSKLKTIVNTVFFRYSIIQIFHTRTILFYSSSFLYGFWLPYRTNVIFDVLVINIYCKHQTNRQIRTTEDLN